MSACKTPNGIGKQRKRYESMQSSHRYPADLCVDNFIEMRVAASPWSCSQRLAIRCTGCSTLVSAALYDD
jgi:hypothetical protein